MIPDINQMQHRFLGGGAITLSDVHMEPLKVTGAAQTKRALMDPDYSSSWQLALSNLLCGTNSCHPVKENKLIFFTNSCETLYRSTTYYDDTSKR